MEDPNNAANSTLTSLYQKTWVVVDTEKAVDKGTVKVCGSSCLFSWLV